MSETDLKAGEAQSFPEFWFYHLTRSSLDQALPLLLERAREKGWTAVVQGVTTERLEALDEKLWTWSDDSFLAHGAARDGDEFMQPIWLTVEYDNPNACAARFMVDRADPVALLDHPAALPSQRVLILFDANDEDAVVEARAHYRLFRSRGLQLAYWRQNDNGRWEKAA